MAKAGKITQIDPREFLTPVWGSIDAAAMREDAYNLPEWIPWGHWPTTAEVIKYASDDKTPGDYSQFWDNVKRYGILDPPKVADNKQMKRLGVTQFMDHYPRVKFWIVDGHHRIAAALKLDMPLISVQWMSNPDKWADSVMEKWHGK